jgi:predicted anti-sigma-YlaC factor YlaD
MNDHAGRCTSAQAPWLREAVGAYVMDALDAEESDVVAEHLAQCASCRGEYLEFRELLPLMEAISEGEARNGPVRPEVPQALVRPEAPVAVEAGRALVFHVGGIGAVSGVNGFVSEGEVPEEGLERRGGHVVRLRHARVVVAALMLVVGCMMGAGMGQAVPGAAAAWSASAGPAAPKADPDAIVTASVLVATAPWGSAIHMVIKHVPDGYECTMVVVASDGRREAAATWWAPTHGTFTVPAATSIAPAEISSIEVRLPDGTLLIAFRHP